MGGEQRDGALAGALDGNAVLERVLVVGQGQPLLAAQAQPQKHYAEQLPRRTQRHDGLRGQVQRGEV